MAGLRFAVDLPEMPPLPHPDDGDEAFVLYTEAYERLRVAIEESPRVAIDLPRDGDTIVASSPEEAVAALTELCAMGYHVPQCAIDTLNEEARQAANHIGDTNNMAPPLAINSEGVKT